MSLDEIQRNVPIKPQQLFFHSELLKPEIELFKDQFERNERFKEFDGLIKANHRVNKFFELKKVLKTDLRSFRDKNCCGQKINKK